MDGEEAGQGADVDDDVHMRDPMNALNRASLNAGSDPGAGGL